MNNEESREPASDLPRLSAPARRALRAARINRLEQLTRFSEAEIGRLHGIGPNALNRLGAALAAKGLRFKAQERAVESRG